MSIHANIEPLTTSQRIVLDAVTAICEERRAARRFPASALRIEIDTRVHRDHPEADHIGADLNELVERGIINEYQAQNYPAYYPLAKDYSPFSR